EVRRAVEPDVAALAAERATPEQIEVLRKHATLTEDPFGEEEPHVRCIRFNLEFHLGIARCVDNHFLEEIVASALDKDQQPLFYGIDLETCTDATAITREHHTILDAIEAGDTKQAHDLMLRHIEEKEARIFGAWQ